MAVVARPLTPAVLREMDVLAGWPPTPPASDAEDNPVRIYRIWTCHGYTDHGNADCGFLRIEREPGGSGGSFSLSIDQQVVHTGGIVHQLKAHVICRNDRLASPGEWTLTSRFFTSEDNQQKDLALIQRGQCWQGRVIFTVNGRARRITCSPRATADWCLFEAIRHLPFDNNKPVEFDMLEGLTTLRPGHQLSYQGSQTFEQAGHKTTLHHFRQLGSGTLPYEYWLDDRRRLVLAVTHTRAYILDPTGEAVVQRLARSVNEKGGKK